MTAPLRVLLTALLLGSVTGSAQTENDAAWWNQLKPDQKSIYLQGFTQGSDSAERFWSGVQSTAPTKLPPEVLAKAQKLTSYTGVSLAQLQTGIDTFYRDPSDAHIQIFDAALIVRYRLGGNDPAFIQHYIAALRRRSAQPAR